MPEPYVLMVGGLRPAKGGVHLLAVAERLRQMGLTPVDVKQHGTGLKMEIVLRPGHVDMKDLAVFSRQFATMVNAGLPILRCVSVLADQTESTELAKVLRKVRTDVEQGTSLTAALARHPKTFSNLFVAMIRTGETTGALGEVLEELAKQIEKETTLRGKVKSAMTYPIAVVGLVLVITLIGFEAMAIATVMPRVSRELHGIRLYGWVFSAFLLASLLGIVLGGRLADRHGPARPFVLGLVLFSAGLVLGGLAPSMPVLVFARAVQGLGAGAIPTVIYVVIGRAYPPVLQPRMFAVLSSAWVLPALIGPMDSGERYFFMPTYVPEGMNMTPDQVPVHLVPCIEGRVEEAGVLAQASTYSSILPAVWSFALAARARGLGTAWTTLHLMFEREAAWVTWSGTPST